MKKYRGEIFAGSLFAVVIGFLIFVVLAILKVENQHSDQAQFCYDHGYTPHNVLISKYGNGCFEGDQVYFNATIAAGRKGKAAQ